MFKAIILADSINIWGHRMTSFQVRFPRIILSELLTHRVFARNTGSSRAKPVNWVISDILEDPFIPEYWGKSQSGMQAFSEISDENKEKTINIWKNLIESCVDASKALADLGVHKQLANRPLEWCQYIDVVITATEFDNFFALRTHKDAQPEIQTISKMMYEAYENSKPQLLLPGQSHLPYVSDEEKRSLDKLTLKKISSARCARVSYKPFNSETASIEKDIDLFDKLCAGVPGHWSPLEHTATSMLIPRRSGPFKGFKQFRKEFKQENIHGFKLSVS